MKKCVICKEEKPLSKFNKNKSKIDGLSTDCKDCCKSYAEVYRLNNKEKLLQQSRAFKNQNRDAINSKNRERYNLIKKLDEDFLMKKRLSSSRYKLNNKGKVNHDTAKRYTAKLNRCCLTTLDDFKVIRLIYQQAEQLSRDTGVVHCVDHIIPLQGKLVSGLHISSNLQILTQSENCSKHNSYIV